LETDDWLASGLFLRLENNPSLLDSLVSSILVADAGYMIFWVWMSGCRVE